MTKSKSTTKRRRAKSGEALSLVKKVASVPDKELPDTCILWPFCVCKVSGYGQMSIGKKHSTAHRWVWELRHGILSKHVVIRHKCRTKNCFNPKHLEPGTHAENNGPDKERDGTLKKGEEGHNAYLTKELILEAYELRKQGHSVQWVADQVGAPMKSLARIFRGESWAHLKLPPLLGMCINGKKCSVKGVIYQNTVKASEHTGMPPGKIQKRCNNPNFPDHFYI